MAPHIQCPYMTCSRTFAVLNGLHRHIQVHPPDHVNEADAVALGTNERADDPEDDGGSVFDAGGVAGACGAAGDVSPGDVDDGDDADGTPHGGGRSSGSSASPSTTADECPHDARTCSRHSALSQSDEDEGSDGSTPVTDSDEEYESEEDSPAGDSPDEDNRPNVNTVFVESLRVQAPVEVHGEMDYGASLSGWVLEWYNSLHDVDRAEPVFSGRDDIGYLPCFATPCLRRVFTYACTANGAGLGRQQTNDFYAVLRAVERDAGGDEALAERFPSKTAFWKAIRNEKRRTVEALGWRSVPIVIADNTYHLLYRHALNVAQQLVLHARAEQLRWGASGPDDADVNDDHVWSGPFDSAAYFDACNDVRDTLREGTKVLGLYGYSDSAVLTGTGDTLTLALCVVDCVLLHPTPARPRAPSAIPSRLLHTSW